MELQGEIDLFKRIKYAQGYRYCNQVKGPQYSLEDDDAESYEDEAKKEGDG